MPIEEIRKALEEAAKQYGALDEHLKELGDVVKTLNINNKAMNALVSQGKFGDATKLSEIFVENRKQAAAKSGQIVSLYEKDMDRQISSFFDGPKSTSDADILNWITGNFLLFKLLSNKSFLTENPCKILLEANERAASAVKLAILFVSKNAPQLLEADSLIEVSEKNYSATLKGCFASLGEEHSMLQGMYSYGSIRAAVKTVAGKHRQAEPQAPEEEQQKAEPQNTENTKSDEQPDPSKKEDEKPDFIKPKQSYKEISDIIDDFRGQMPPSFEPLAGFFNRKNFVNGSADLNLDEQPMKETMLGLLSELSEGGDDIDKTLESEIEAYRKQHKDAEDLNAEKIYGEIADYYRRLRDFSLNYVSEPKLIGGEIIEKSIRIARMIHSHAQVVLENCNARIEILEERRKNLPDGPESTSELLDSAAKNVVAANKEDRAKYEADAIAEDNKKAAAEIIQTDINAAIIAELSEDEKLGVHQSQADWLARKAQEKAELGNKFDIFHSKAARYTPHLNLLEKGKTFSNSGEYLKLISTLNDLAEGKYGTNDDLTSEERYFSQLVDLKLKIDNYIVHKSKDGVKKNVYGKLYAVEGLNRYVTEELDALAPDILKDKSNPKMQDSKQKYIVIKNASLHPEFKQTYTPEQAVERGLNAREYNDSFQTKSCEKVLTCMDRIIHFAKQDKVKDLKKMQEEFYYNPGRGEYPGKADAKRALDIAESARHMDPARKSGLKSVLDLGGEFKFDSEDYHTELKYCYAMKKNIRANLRVLKDNEVEHSNFSMAEADALIGDYVSKTKSEKSLFGSSSKQFYDDRDNIRRDITKITDAVDKELVSELKDNFNLFSANLYDKALLKKWPDLSITGECYKAALQEKQFDWNGDANKQKAQEIVDLYTKLENKIKHIAGVAIEEPEKKIALKVDGPVK